MGGTNVAELDEVVAAKDLDEGHDELNELAGAKGHDELNELTAAKGHDELDELTVADGNDQLNEFTVAKSHDELNEVVATEGNDELIVARADQAKETTANIFLPFSLTKYSANIAEVNEYFGINGLGNQHRPLNVMMTQ